MGAIASFIVAHFVGGGVAGMVLASIAGVLAGFLYGAIPGALRAYRGAHEVISTIMLNFVAIQIGRYLVGIGGPLQKKNSGTPFSEKLDASLRWPHFWGEFETNQVHIGLFLALVAVVRLLGRPRAHDARLRGAGRRVQPRGGALRRRLRAARRGAVDGHRGRLRRPRRARARRSATTTSCRRTRSPACS